MYTTATIRYVSGREEKFEFEVLGGSGMKARLEAFVKTPNLVLQTATEVVIIPAHAIESISIALPEDDRTELSLGDIRVVKRLE
jgi:small nuclear ribonucleoprotein (snRNP)-like protein